MRASLAISVSWEDEGLVRTDARPGGGAVSTPKRAGLPRGRIPPPLLQELLLSPEALAQFPPRSGAARLHHGGSTSVKESPRPTHTPLSLTHSTLSTKQK